MNIINIMHWRVVQNQLKFSYVFVVFACRFCRNSNSASDTQVGSKINDTFFKTFFEELVLRSLSASPLMDPSHLIVFWLSAIPNPDFRPYFNSHIVEVVWRIEYGIRCTPRIKLLNSGWGHLVVVLSKTLNSHSTSQGYIRGSTMMV